MTELGAISDAAPEQATIRCVILRGGTSKGLYFHASDLPSPGPRRDKLLQRLMGSPDVLQIDGLGGSRPITSKVAIVARSQRDDADVDYTFAQVEIESEGVVYSGNCGNISAGVGPFVVDEGLVSATDGHTRVRIHNTNTGKLIIADVPVRNGKARVEGDFVVPGVPGSGAEIAMNWADTVGATTGRLLPTGNPVDQIRLESGRVIDVTLCDAANPCAWVYAADLGLDGSELVQEINRDQRLIELVREVRGKAAVRFGFCTDWRLADEDSPGLPMVGLVAPPKDYDLERRPGGRAGHGPAGPPHVHEPPARDGRRNRLDLPGGGVAGAGLGRPRRSQRRVRRRVADGPSVRHHPGAGAGPPDRYTAIRSV